MVKLAVRALPTLTFKRRLPDYLAGGKECFLEVDLRPGGAVNPAFSAAMDNVLMHFQTRRRILEGITDPAENTAKDVEFARAMARDRFAALYDACVIEWRSNILDDGKPIACTRENFLALAEERVPEIADAFVSMEKQAIEAGAELRKQQDQSVKN